MSGLTNPSISESFMQVGVEGLFLLDYLTVKHPDLLDEDCGDSSITVDMFIAAMHEGYVYIAQHSEFDLVKMAVEGKQYGSIGKFDYMYWLFGKWLHEEPTGFAETACKIFPIIIVGLFGPSIGVQSTADRLAAFYSARDESFDEFYQSRLRLVMKALPELIPDRATIAMVETALASNKFDNSQHTLEDLGELGQSLGLM